MAPYITNCRLVERYSFVTLITTTIRNADFIVVRQLSYSVYKAVYYPFNFAHIISTKDYILVAPYTLISNSRNIFRLFKQSAPSLTVLRHIFRIFTVSAHVFSLGSAYALLEALNFRGILNPSPNDRFRLLGTDPIYIWHQLSLG